MAQPQQRILFVGSFMSYVGPGSYPAAFEIVGWSATAGFNVNY
jgi:hypothetical protein